MDLYYRFNVFPIHIRPLRERTEDILKLVDLFIDQFNEDEKEISGAKSNRITGVTENAKKYLKYATWVGNVRELRNAIEYAFIHAKAGELQPTNFPKPQLELADVADASSVEPSDVAEPEPRESGSCCFSRPNAFQDGFASEYYGYIQTSEHREDDAHNGCADKRGRRIGVAAAPGNAFAGLCG